MGALLSSLMSRCITFWSRWARAGESNEREREQERPPDVEEGEDKVNSATPKTPKRRALLVGISYRRRPSKTWSPLDGTYGDVKRFRNILISAYSSERPTSVILTCLPQIPTNTPQKTSLFLWTIPISQRPLNQPVPTWSFRSPLYFPHDQR